MGWWRRRDDESDRVARRRGNDDCAMGYTPRDKYERTDDRSLGKEERANTWSATRRTARTCGATIEKERGERDESRRANATLKVAIWYVLLFPPNLVDCHEIRSGDGGV